MKLVGRSVGIGTAALVGSVLLIWGCLSQPQVYDIPSFHRPALHAVHGERLASKMKGINKYYHKAHRLPIRQMRARGFRNLEHCAEQIAIYAASLPELVDLSSLSAEDRAMFERLAERLKANAEGLRAAAESEDGPAVRERFAKLTSTCNSCHAAFRQPIAEHRHGGAQ